MYIPIQKNGRKTKLENKKENSIYGECLLCYESLLLLILRAARTRKGTHFKSHKRGGCGGHAILSVLQFYEHNI